MLTATGLAKAHGNRTLFRDVTLTLVTGRRIALIGGNGAGKTTLIEIIMGDQDADAGTVHHANDLRIGYLPQDLTETATGTVIEETVAGAGLVTELGARLAELEARLGEGDEKVLDEYGEVQSSFEQLGGYSLESEAHRILAGLGFDHESRDRPVRELSGGWRMRVALGRLLLSNPDLLILDEPTNHLDVDSVAWLESQLQSWPGALLFVSHDRDFIDNVANRVVELASGTATEYVGGFAEFVTEREERLAALRAAAAGQARQIAHTEKFVERFRYKATKARQVQSRIKALEKLDRIEIPDETAIKARFRFPEPPRGSRVVAELDGVTAGYDDVAVLRDVSMVLERGWRVALVGPNGAGKTTLLKLLLGELDPMAGTVTIGQNVDHASFAQHQTEVLDDRLMVVDEFRRSVPEKAGRNLRTLLGAFGFPGDAAERLVGDLSGGEKTRLALGKTMVEPHNLLVLDEPTNHLDLPSCDILEDALRAYEGTVLLVTHDRYLIRSVATALVVVRNGRATFHDGVDERLLAPEGGGASFSGAAGLSKAAATPSPKSTKHKATKSGKSGQSTQRAQSVKAAQSGSAAPAGGARDPRRVAKGQPEPSTAQKKAEKRLQAERRNKRHKELKPLRSAVNRAEKAWEAAEGNLASLQAKLADPGVYERHEEANALVKEHDVAKEAAVAAMAAWEEATTRLEQVENAP